MIIKSPKLDTIKTENITKGSYLEQELKKMKEAMSILRDYINPQPSIYINSD